MSGRPGLRTGPARNTQNLRISTLGGSFLRTQHNPKRKGGSPTETYKIQVDGYSVGDRLLEGVTFDVTVDVMSNTAYHVKDVRVNPLHYDYFSDLNEAKWLAAVKEYVEEDISMLWEWLGEVVDDDGWNHIIDTFHPTYPDGTPIPRA